MGTPIQACPTQPKHDWIPIAAIAIAGLPGVAALIALIFTFQSVKETNAQLQIAEQGQITDRYNAAIANLGSTSVDVRLGGIYALQRIMEDSPRDQPTVVAVLCAFVRDHAGVATTSGLPPTNFQADHPPTDIQAALTVVTTRNTADDGSTTVVDFTNTNLYGADLSGAHLSGAHLRYANLGFADLEGADLDGADIADASLGFATLTGAHLSSADLEGTRLGFATLSGAHLVGADLADANLMGAYMEGADLADAVFRVSAPGVYLFRANLTHADLRYADLSHANIADADLTGANLTNAKLINALVSGVDFSGANLGGLEWSKNVPAPAPKGWVYYPGSDRLQRANAAGVDTGN